MSNPHMKNIGNGEKGKKGDVKKMLAALKPYKWKIGIALVCILISTVLSVYAPQWLSKLTDEIANNAGTRTVNMDTVTKIAVVLIVFYGTNALSNYIANFIMSTVTQRFSQRLRTAISEKINKVPLDYYDTRVYGDTLSVVTNDVDTLGQNIDQAISMLFSSACMLIAVLIAMFVTSWQMALTVLLMIPFMLVLIMLLTRLAMPQFRRNQGYLAELNGKVEENYGGHNVIAAFNAGARKARDFESVNTKLQKAVFKGNAIAGFMMPAMSFVSYFAYAAVCVVGGILLSADTVGISFGTITAFLVYINLFQNPMSQLAQAANSLQMAAAAAGRGFEFLEQPELSDETGKTRKILDENGNGKVRGEVEFKNVRFGYSPDKIIIPDFSAKVEAGMKVAIVGPTGAGKTTMVNLLMRFYELTDGDITIDGVSIKDMPRDEIHDIFGMVLQDTWMFDGSIRDNILFSKSGVDDARLEEICREAGISHYVRTLPGGLDYVMDSESNISGGQKQLITIARAMAENAPLLILDEATSNVDTRTEELIQTAMDKLTEGRTSFVIAHRLSTIKNADLILVMKDGNIIEQGNHDELIAKDGFYAGLYNSQFAAA